MSETVVDWNNRGLGPVSKDVFYDELDNRLTLDEARDLKDLGEDIIVNLVRKGGRQRYEARFTRIGPDHDIKGATSASFIIHISPGEVEGRRFIFGQNGRLTMPVNGATESQLATGEIGGYVQKKAPPGPAV